MVQPREVLSVVWKPSLPPPAPSTHLFPLSGTSCPPPSTPSLVPSCSSVKPELQDHLLPEASADRSVWGRSLSRVTLQSPVEAFVIFHNLFSLVFPLDSKMLYTVCLLRYNLHTVKCSDINLPPSQCCEKSIKAQNILSPPKTPFVPLSNRPPPPEQLVICFPSPQSNFACSKKAWAGIRHSVPFCVSSFSPSARYFGDTAMLHESVVGSLNDWVMFHWGTCTVSVALVLMDAWLVSNLGLLRIKLHLTFLCSLFVNYVFISLG